MRQPITMLLRIIDWSFLTLMVVQSVNSLVADRPAGELNHVGDSIPRKVRSDAKPSGLTSLLSSSLPAPHRTKHCLRTLTDFLSGMLSRKPPGWKAATVSAYSLPKSPALFSVTTWPLMVALDAKMTGPQMK